MRPPQPPPRWTHSPADLTQEIARAIARDRQTTDAIAALPQHACNFTSVFHALDRAESALSAAFNPLSFYQNVSPNKDLRDASNDADVLVNDYGVECSMRQDLYDAQIAAAKNIDQAGETLAPEDRRLVDKMLLEGKRAGLALPENERSELMRLRKELSQTCLEFSKNFNEENGTVAFTLAELEGVPRDVMSGYTKRSQDSSEVYEISFKAPDIFPVFKYAVNPETRKRAHEAYEARLSTNAPLLDKALEIRRTIAGMLGYANWADYITEEMMVKSARNAMTFLDDLERKLRPVGVKDRETLLEMKREEHARRGLAFDGEFYIWDYRYYDRQFVERELVLDDDEVKKYFPVDVVVPTILEIYQHLLGVQFVKFTADAWHPEVQQFEVWNQNPKDESDFMGYCYLDLFPRPSKFGHAGVWGMLLDGAEGKPSVPVEAMVANLAKPTPDRPALMRHADVVTFFHEMGHAFHGLLSRTKFARFHGTSVARDFVEAPSQMLENWCWEPRVLERMSSHFETKEPLSGELIDKIIRSRYVNVGLYYLRQLFFAKFDMKVHMDTEPADYTALWNDMRTSISFVKGGTPQPGQGAFGHITSGYDAGYYGYTYSLVFAADMYSTVFKKDPLDPALGRHYRKTVLVPGGSRDEMESLKAFLGRPPNSDAFMNELFGSEGMKAVANL